MNALSNGGIAVAGNSQSNYGVLGQSNTGTGVAGISDAWVGTYGQSNSSVGAWGRSNANAGVVGESNQWIGVYGVSTQFEGVRGETSNNAHGALVGVHLGSGIAIYGISNGGGYAGWFDGRVRVQVLEIAGGADLAEKFDTSEKAEPGTVMAIDPAKPGSLRVSRTAYNRKVAGVVSGAGNLSAGVVLSDPSGTKDGLPIAMSGRIWTQCDTSNGPIEAGDLLTTSATPGRAMKVTDHARATGATIGKAMTELASGEGLVLVLVSLQ